MRVCTVGIWVLRCSTRWVSAAVALTLFLAVRPSAQGPTLVSVLETAALYITQFKQDLSAVVAEEVYSQEFRSAGLAPLGPTASRQTRVLRSDLLLVNLAAGRYVQFRDVFEVDGEPVRDREQRLTQLFLATSPSAVAQRERILATSARYNIGNVQRTINVPTMPLMFLEAEFQSRFRFSRSNNPTTPSVLGVENRPPTPRAWVVDYRETARQTIVRRANGRADLPARGRFWIEPDSGRVLMTEMIIDDASIKTVVNVLYESDPRSGIYVPTVMKERYESGQSIVEGRAVYTNFRRFTVSTEENLRTAK